MVGAILLKPLYHSTQLSSLKEFVPKSSGIPRVGSTLEVVYDGEDSEAKGEWVVEDLHQPVPDFGIEGSGSESLREGIRSGSQISSGHGFKGSKCTTRRC